MTPLNPYAIPERCGKYQTLREQVTPETAAYYLTRNRNPRTLRPSWVAELADMMRRGLFHETPDGLAFDREGYMRNGQHRCAAIVESGRTQVMTVTVGLADVQVAALDQGLKRSMRDVLQAPAAVVDGCVAAVRFVTNRHRPSAEELGQLMNGPLGALFLELAAACGTTRRYFTSGSMRLGAVVNLIRYPKERDYVLGTWRALALADIAHMSPAAMALYRQVTSQQTTHSTDRTDTVARALIVFNPRRRNATKIQVTSPEVALREARAALAPLMVNGKEPAP